jgi:hypothetical protein
MFCARDSVCNSKDSITFLLNYQWVLFWWKEGKKEKTNFLSKSKIGKMAGVAGSDGTDVMEVRFVILFSDREFFVLILEVVVWCGRNNVYNVESMEIVETCFHRFVFSGSILNHLFVV